jgi:hypothetical protein
MKKLIVLMIAIIPVFVMAQGTPISALYDKYSSKPGYETTEILPASMSFDWEKSMDNNTVRDMMKSIESIKILKCKEGSSAAEQSKLWKKMQKAAGEADYKEVVSVSAEKMQMNVYMLKTSAGNTREVAMLSKGENGVTMVAVTGDMDFSSLFSAENMKSLREMAEYYMHSKGNCKPE